jgi:hypothetical protein
MKNEREKEIENVNPHRHSGGPFEHRDKVRQQITNHQQLNAYISISRTQREIKAKGDVYVVNGKEREAKK